MLEEPAKHETVDHKTESTDINRPDNQDPLFDPEWARDQATHHFKPQLDTSAAIRTFGVNLIKRCFAYKRDEFSALVAYGGLLRQVLVSFDGLVTLAGEGALEAAGTNLRTCYEAELSLQFLLAGETVLRAHLWYAASLRNERARLLQLETEIEVQRKDHWRDRVEDITKLLASTPYKEADGLLEAGRRRHEVPWFAVGPGAVSNYREMAKALDREREYRILYEDLSARTHARYVHSHFKRPSASTISLEPFRALRDLPTYLSLGNSFAIRAIQAIVDRWRPQDAELLKLSYLEWREHLRFPAVVENPIFVDI